MLSGLTRKERHYGCPEPLPNIPKRAKRDIGGGIRKNEEAERPERVFFYWKNGEKPLPGTSDRPWKFTTEILIWRKRKDNRVCLGDDLGCCPESTGIWKELHCTEIRFHGERRGKLGGLPFFRIYGAAL